MHGELKVMPAQPNVACLTEKLNELSAPATPSEPTDGQFYNLVDFKRHLIKAADYIGGSEFPALDALSAERKKQASHAFEHALLPRTLIEFKAVAADHGWLKPLNMFNNKTRSTVSLGKFKVVYATENHHTHVELYRTRLLGSNKVALDFDVNARPSEGEARYTVNWLDPKFMDETKELAALAKSTAFKANEDRERRGLKQAISQHNF